MIDRPHHPVNGDLPPVKTRRWRVSYGAHHPRPTLGSATRRVSTGAHHPRPTLGTAGRYHTSYTVTGRIRYQQAHNGQRLTHGRCCA
ncbi:MAG: hypothetical protein H6651_01320 [Ardenticatenales bacterium]|nr:hypothetical protein [Ardenticatenales bacterium]